MENWTSVGRKVWPSYGECLDDASSGSRPGFLVLGGSARQIVAMLCHQATKNISFPLHDCMGALTLHRDVDDAHGRGVVAMDGNGGLGMAHF